MHFVLINIDLKIAKLEMVDLDGQIINLIGNDGTRIENCLLYFPYLFVGPIQALVIIGLLVKMIDVSILSGLVLLLVFIPLQSLLGKLMDRLKYVLQKILFDIFNFKF